jgi:isopentenyl-diphosphate Delta-isomerase
MKTINDEQIEEWGWESGCPLGRAVSRKKAHREGTAHEGVHLWILRTVRGFPEILFQHRAGSKELYPGCLDITVGGHVVFGHNKNKIQKESYEEIGISPMDDEMIDLGYFRYEEKNEIVFHREFQRVYLLHDNRELFKYSFNDKEVDGIYAVKFSDLEILFNGDLKFPAEGYDGNKMFFIEVSRRDFHPLLFAPEMEGYMKILLKAINELIVTGKVLTKMPIDPAYVYL